MQEYFAAFHILRDAVPLFSGTDMPRALKKRLWKEFNRYQSDSGWYEILAIASGILPMKPEGESIQRDYIDRLWRTDRLLGAMCQANAESADDNRVAEYADQIRHRIEFLAIDLPKIYPWLLLSSSLFAVWGIPDR